MKKKIMIFITGLVLISLIILQYVQYKELNRIHTKLGVIYSDTITSVNLQLNSLKELITKSELEIEIINRLYGGLERTKRELSFIGSEMGLLSHVIVVLQEDLYNIVKAYNEDVSRFEDPKQDAIKEIDFLISIFDIIEKEFDNAYIKIYKELDNNNSATNQMIKKEFSDFQRTWK